MLEQVRMRNIRVFFGFVFVEGAVSNDFEQFLYTYVIATLSVYPHRASLKNMHGHGGIRTYEITSVLKELDSVLKYHILEPT